MEAKKKEAKKDAKKNAAKSTFTTITDRPSTASAAKMLSRLGGGISNRGLSANGMRLADSAKLHQEALTTTDWTPTSTQALTAAVLAFDAAETAATQAKEASKDATAAYVAAVADGIVFRDTLAANIRLAALGNPEILQRTPLKLKSARQGQGLAKWFIDVPALIEKVSTELKQLSSTDWLAEVQQAQAKLASALAAHQQLTTRKAELAQDRLVRRNQLVAQIDALALHAGVAFLGNKAVLAQFRKGLARRKAKASKKATPVEKVSSPAVAPAAAAAPVGAPLTAEAVAANAKPDGQAASDAAQPH